MILGVDRDRRLGPGRGARWSLRPRDVGLRPVARQWEYGALRIHLPGACVRPPALLLMSNGGEINVPLAEWLPRGELAVMVGHALSAVQCCSRAAARESSVNARLGRSSEDRTPEKQVVGRVLAGCCRRHPLAGPLNTFAPALEPDPSRPGEAAIMRLDPTG